MFVSAQRGLGMTGMIGIARFNRDDLNGGQELALRQAPHADGFEGLDDLWILVRKTDQFEISRGQQRLGFAEGMRVAGSEQADLKTGRSAPGFRGAKGGQNRQAQQSTSASEEASTVHTKSGLASLPFYLNQRDQGTEIDGGSGPRILPT